MIQNIKNITHYNRVNGISTDFNKKDGQGNPQQQNDQNQEKEKKKDTPSFSVPGYIVPPISFHDIQIIDQ